MVSNCQIIIVGTGYQHTVDEYYLTERYANDRPLYVIRRDGSLEVTPHGVERVVAIENVGPVVNVNGLWLPATTNEDGRYVAITEDCGSAVRAPYEFCSCRPYHGCIHYEYVGDKQLRTLRDLLAEWLQEYGIRYPYDNQLGVICPRAVAGKSGIYFASSTDIERSDIHPQREIIDIIKSLAK